MRIAGWLGRTFDLAPRSVLRRWTFEHDVNAIVSPDGKTIAIANLPSVWAIERSSSIEKEWRRAVVLLDRETLDRPRVLVTDFEILSFAFDATSRFVVAESGVYSLRASHGWRVDDGSVVTEAITPVLGAPLGSSPAFDERLAALAPPFEIAHRLAIAGEELRVSGTSREVIWNLASGARVGDERTSYADQKTPDGVRILQRMASYGILHPGKYVTLQSLIWDTASDVRTALDGPHMDWTKACYALAPDFVIVTGNEPRGPEKPARKFYISRFAAPSGAVVWHKTIESIGPSSIEGTAVAIGSDLIAVAYQQPDLAELYLLRASDGEVVDKLGGFHRIGALAFAEDGRTLYAAYDPEAIAIISL